MLKAYPSASQKTGPLILLKISVIPVVVVAGVLLSAIFFPQSFIVTKSKAAPPIKSAGSMGNADFFASPPVVPAARLSTKLPVPFSGKSVDPPGRLLASS
jgi:hypothetical protein